MKLLAVCNPGEVGVYLLRVNSNHPTRVIVTAIVGDEAFVNMHFERLEDGTLKRSDGKVFPGVAPMLRQLSESGDGVLACPLNRLLASDSTASSA